jgi:hypothetical protein
MASGGVGSAHHVYGELFKMMAGVDLVHVPYRGAGPALVDLLAGQVQVMFAFMTSSIEYIRAGKLRALAVATATRSEALPDIPTPSLGRYRPQRRCPPTRSRGPARDPTAEALTSASILCTWTSLNGK